MDQTQKSSRPWFIREFRGRYIMLFRDFESITGVRLFGNCKSSREFGLKCGRDYNGFGWHTEINREEFLKEHGFDYGDDECMMYLYFESIKKALELWREAISREAYKTISEAVLQIRSEERRSK